MPEIKLEDFAALLRRAGFKLPEAKIAELYGAWSNVEKMLVCNRTPMISRGAEPSPTFKPEGF
jgi:hypothetical protein